MPETTATQKHRFALCLLRIVASDNSENVPSLSDVRAVELIASATHDQVKRAKLEIANG